jgi:class 3 adenylate cyclase/CheY-like chemotaxis protein
MADGSDDARRATSHLRHELRTPINQIIGYSELLQEEAAEQGQQSFVADLGRITLAARRLLAVVEAGLDALVHGPSAPAAAVAPGVAAAPGAEPEAPPRHLGSLLVVDDDPANRDMLARRLLRRGHTVAMAESGEAALEALRKGGFDLVLLDVMMPGISGLEVLETVRRDTNMADLPVIMATARDGSEDTVAALRLGANDYVTKPLDFPVVQARVETHLGLKRAMDEVQRLAAALELRNGFIRRLFGRYVSDEVVSTLLESPAGLRLGGEKRTVTILMADLRGFSGMAERLPPEQVVSTLNNYLGAMTDIITAHQGTIDEFIGDAILALFGAPIAREDDARRACACALEMQLAMEGVNERNRGLGLPDLQMGIAVNTGEVVVGNVGSHKRAKYGVVGSPVNLAGRIESYTVGGQVLISESTLKGAGALEVEGRMTIEVKGFAEPVSIYSLRGMGGEGGVRLPDGIEEMTALTREIPVSFTVLEGKHGTGVELAGRLVRLSMQGADVRSEGTVEPLRDVRLRVTGFHGTQLPGELYAKVMSASPDGGGFHVRFTSVPPEALDLFKSALDGTRG